MQQNETECIRVPMQMISQHAHAHKRTCCHINTQRDTGHSVEETLDKL